MRKYRRLLWGMAFGVAPLLSVLGCGDAATTCTPGQQVSCACPGGAEGVQVCNADGESLGACQCSSGAGAGSVGGEGQGAGSQGGDGQGGDAPCAPAAVEDCYEGPPGTKDVGPCVGGTRICGVDGMWGACMGQVLPATEDCQTPADENCDGATPACAEAWALQLGDNSSVLFVDTDSAGNVYIMGQFEDTVDFGNGNTLTDVGVADVFVAKLSASGVHEWSFQLGDPIDALEPTALVVDPSGVAYVAVNFFGNPTFLGQSMQSEGERDIALLRILPDGSPDWITSFGSTGTDHIYDFVLDGDGNLVFVPFHAAPIYFGGTDTLNVPSLAVVKLMPDLTHVFGRDLAPPGGVYAGVDLDPVTQDIVVVAPMYGQTDLGMGVVSSTLDGQVFTARLDAAGNVLSYGASGGQFANVASARVAVLSTGASFVRATYSGIFDNGEDPPISQQGSYGDLVVFNEDSGGTDAWLNHYFSPGTGYGLQSIGRLHVRGNDQVVIPGFGSGTFDLGNGPITDQAFLLTLDGATGAYVDSVTYPNSVIFYAVAYAPDGVPIVSGLHSGPAVNIGGTTLPIAAGSGMVARLAP